MVVTVTTPDERLAAELARVLVGERLAACAQVGGPIGSTYRWDGEVQVDREWLLTAKTVESQVPALARRVQEEAMTGWMQFLQANRPVDFLAALAIALAVWIVLALAKRYGGRFLVREAIKGNESKVPESQQPKK